MITTTETDTPQSRYEKLARRAALGETIDAAEIEEVLTASGESPETLARLVGQLQHRAGVRASLAIAAGVSERYVAVRQQIEGENAKLEQAVEQHRAAAETLQRELADLRQLVGKASASQHDLFSSAPPQLLAAHKAAFEDFSAMSRRVETNRADLETVRNTPPRGEIAQHEAHVNRLEQELARLEGRRAELEAEEKRAYRTAIEW